MSDHDDTDSLSKPGLSRLYARDGTEAYLAIDVLGQTAVERALDDGLVSEDVLELSSAVEWTKGHTFFCCCLSHMIYRQ